MDTQSVWEFLSSISVGTVVAWIVVVCASISIICTGTIKLYKLFIKYKELRDKDDEQKKLLEKHSNVLEHVNRSLENIEKSLNEQKEVNLRQIRYTIVHICNEAISRGEISAGKLRSLEEMYEEYTDIFHGNGYVKTLMKKARTLPVIGKLDE